MKPVLYDNKGRPIRFKADDGKVYEPAKPEQFAPWDGSPLKIIEPPARIEPHQTLKIVAEFTRECRAAGGPPEPYTTTFPPPPLHTQVADKTAIAHAKQSRKPVTFWKPKWTPPEPPEVVAVKESLDSTQRSRAETMRRLGGGPLARAQRAANSRMAQEQAEGIKMLLDGIRKRPVL